MTCSLSQDNIKDGTTGALPFGERSVCGCGLMPSDVLETFVNRSVL